MSFDANANNPILYVTAESREVPITLEQCRICEELEVDRSKLVEQICKCKGHHGSVHLFCLRKWIFLRPPPKRYEMEVAHFRVCCEICQHPYENLPRMLIITSMVRADISENLLAIHSSLDRKAAENEIASEFSKFADEMDDDKSYVNFLNTLLQLSLRKVVSNHSREVEPIRVSRHRLVMMETSLNQWISPFCLKIMLRFCIFLLCSWPIAAFSLVFSGLIPFASFSFVLAIIILLLLALTSILAICSAVHCCHLLRADEGNDLLE